MTELIYSDPSSDLEVRLDHRVPPDLLELLSQTTWGQHGLSFRSLDMAAMLGDLSDPSFLRLVKGGRTVAAAVRNRKHVEMAGKPYDAIHLALFAVHLDFARQGLGTILARVSRNHFFSILRPPGLLYGYIESGNEASLRLNLGLGYQQDMGQVSSRLFSRTRPQSSPRVEVLGREARPDMLNRLKKAYKAHALCSFENSLDPERYFVVRRDGEIVAGAQLQVLHWELFGLPDWQGRLAMNLLPHIPFLGRDFTPSDLRFVRVGNIYAENGAEEMVAEILETALAEQHIPFAALLADRRGETERRVMSRMNFGAIDRIVTGGFHFLAEFKGVDAGALRKISRMPVIISPKDPL